MRGGEMAPICPVCGISYSVVGHECVNLVSELGRLRGELRLQSPGWNVQREKMQASIEWAIIEWERAGDAGGGPADLAETIMDGIVWPERDT